MYLIPNNFSFTKYKPCYGDNQIISLRIILNLPLHLYLATIDGMIIVISELGQRGKEFSAKDLVSSVVSAANRKMKKRDKSSKNIASIDTGSVDVTEPPCEYNERNIDYEIEMRSITEDSSMDMTQSSIASGPSGTPITGHGMASSSSTLTSTLSQERLLQQAVSTTSQLQQQHRKNARSQSTAGLQHRSHSQERLLSQQSSFLHSHSAGHLPSAAADTPLTTAADGIYNAKLVYITGTESQPNMTSTPQQSRAADNRNNRQSVHYEVTKYPAYQLQQYELFQTENAKPQLNMRRGSADSILSSERREDDEIGHHPSSVSRSSRTYQAQQHMKRLQLEAAALRQKEDQRRIESEKRAIAKQRIEMELEKTKAELERDDSLEELLAKPTQIAAQIADYHAKYADTTSLTSTSDYSTMSSTTGGADRHVHAQIQPQASTTSDFSSNASPPSTHRDISEASEYPQSTEGGKYFVVTSPSTPKTHHVQTKQKSEVNGRLSNFDTSKVAGRGTLSRKKSDHLQSPVAARKTIEFSPRSRQHSRTGSAGQRRGSLDSNRDFFEKPYTTFDSDSETSEDLLDSMTSAFDEKLKALGSGHGGDGDQGTRSHWRPESYTVNYMQRASHPSPHQPYEIYRNNSEGMLFDRYFKDSNRYSCGKRDPKIGIASRFERKEPIGQERSPDEKKEFSYEKSRTGFGLRRDLSEPGTKKHDFSDLSPKRSMSADARCSPISKLEKTETNLLTKELDARNAEYAQALRRSSEKLYGSKEYLVDIDLEAPSPEKPSVEIQKAYSPQVVRRNNNEEKKRQRRRHTVGGTKDLEHFKALMMATDKPMTSSPEAEKLSAWDRLQPAVAQGHGSDGRSLKSWLEQQRLHHVGSSPAIFQGGDLQPLRDHDYYSTDLDDPSDTRLQSVGGRFGTPRHPHHPRYSQPIFLSSRDDGQSLPLQLVSHPTHSSVSSPDSCESPSPSETSRSRDQTGKFTFESSI